jgi:hypothetical protein
VDDFVDSFSCCGALWVGSEESKSLILLSTLHNTRQRMRETPCKTFIRQFGGTSGGTWDSDSMLFIAR